MYLPVVLSIAVFILFLILKSKIPAIKGAAGENIVSSMLNFLPKDKYIVLNDVMLHTSHGTSQIDHVILSVYGIFVIETKNYKGWIYGGDNSENWIKNVYGNKYEFRNPLKQNYAHVKALQEILDIKTQKNFISVIAFSNKAKLKVHSSKHVVNFQDLNYTIRSYKNEVMTFEECTVLAQKLNSSTEYTKEQKKEHVKEVKQTSKDRQKKIQHNICPICGGQLVQKSGKYGKFYGCENYPKCRFTKKE